MTAPIRQPAPELVISLRLAHAQQSALGAYRQFLRDNVLPYPGSTDLKLCRTAARNLVSADSVELLIYPWRFSSFVTPTDLEAAGLEPSTACPPQITRRALGQLLRKQYLGDDGAAYERRASRAVDAWLLYRLVEEIEWRSNLKEIRATPLLDELVRTYLMTFARETSPELAPHGAESVAVHG